MTRAEMENIWMGFCNTQKSCHDCPLNDRGSCDWGEVTDTELEKVVEFIRGTMDGNGCTTCTDVQHQQKDSGAVTVNRDLLNTIKGELLMLAACDGATITHGVSDELISIVENIDAAIAASEVVYG